MAVRKTKAGLALKRWFKEDWKDQRTGKACGRRKASVRVASQRRVAAGGRRGEGGFELKRG